MGYATGSLGRPIQGVSQQPPQSRQKGQSTEQINFKPDVVEGLVTRPCTWRGYKLRDLPIPENALVYDYDRGTDEEYYIIIEDDGSIEIYSRATGVKNIVNVDANTLSYLQAGGNPKANLKLTTISDFTFIVNTSVTVSESSTQTSKPLETAIFYVQFMDYQQTQNIYYKLSSSSTWILGATYASPDGSTTSHLGLVATDYVASQLNAGLSGQSGYTTQLEGNCIFFRRTDGQSFDIKTEDDAGQANLIGLKDTVPNTSKLSPKAPDDFIIEIDPAGSDTVDNANYWLKAVNGTGDVTWSETVAPYISIGMDKTTMPLTLIRESITGGVATFSLTLGDWEDRDVGDDRTNPLPSFVGAKLSSIGLNQNRLFFTSSENQIMSRTKQYFKFFRDSAQVSLDTDPIDVYADAEQVNVLEQSLPFDGDLIMFSENSQFSLSGDKVATSSNAVLRLTTSFSCYLGVAPVASGENIFFAFEYGDSTGIREYFTDSITDTKRAKPVTDHVNQYIIGKPTIMKSSTGINTLLVKTDEDDDLIYIYDWLWQGNEKVQSAWHKWRFGGDNIEYFNFNKSSLYLIIERPDGVWLEYLDVGDPLVGNIPYEIKLDRKSYVTLTWSESEERWETPDIFPDYDLGNLVGILDLDTDQSGDSLFFDREGSVLHTLTDAIDHTVSSTYEIILGIKIMAELTTTEPIPKDSEGTPLSLDKLTVGHLHFAYTQTGKIEYVVTDSFGRSRTVEKGNRRLNFPNNLVGYDKALRGEHVIAIKRRSSDYTCTLMTDDHRPIKIRDIQFDGNFKQRGRRLAT